MSLTEYNKKRTFSKTSEPFGKPKSSQTTRFVVGLHRASRKHYDLRLEHNGVLISFAVPKGLSLNPREKRLAVMVEDHPLDYLNFEGIIPEGNYGAGTVEIFDTGTYAPLFDFDAGLKKGHLRFVLNGEILKGEFNLIKTDEKNWLVVKAQDEFACDKKPKKSSLPFKTLKAQLATLSNALPKGKDWVFEIKYDGFRMLAFVENGKAKIVSRNAIDYTQKLADITKSIEALDAENFVLDGEIVAFDKTGRSDFGLLQENLKLAPQNLRFVVFDLLALNGENLMPLPLKTRKQKLEMLVFKANENIVFSADVANGTKCFEFAQKHNLEGVIAKKQTLPYFEGRSDGWLKIKCVKRQEFVVAGFTTTSKNPILSALILGYYKNNNLIFVGKVGVGLSETTKHQLAKKFKPFERKTCPFKQQPNLKNVHWVSPKFVAETAFAEITKDNLLRQPKFIGLRTDKKAQDVVLESDYGNN